MADHLQERNEPPDLAGLVPETEFVCTDAPPSADDAYLSDELAAARERGDHATVARIEHCFAMSRQVNPTNDPLGSPAWQRALELGVEVNRPAREARRDLARQAQASADEHGNREAAAIAEAIARDADRQLARGHRLLYRRAAHGGQTKIISPAPLRVRMARPRGAGRPRASASRSSSRSGDSGDSGPGEPPPPALAGPSPRFSRPWRPGVEAQVVGLPDASRAQKVAQNAPLDVWPTSRRSA